MSWESKPFRKIKKEIKQTPIKSTLAGISLMFLLYITYQTCINPYHSHMINTLNIEPGPKRMLGSILNFLDTWLFYLATDLYKGYYWLANHLWKERPPLPYEIKIT